MLLRLAEREAKRQDDGGASRFQKGDLSGLYALQNGARFLRPCLKMTIVQPGVSKSRTSPEQLELLGATQSYLMETHQIPLAVVCSS